MIAKIATTPEELKSVYEIRRTVFIEEQQVPEDLEIDDLEESSTHFLVIDGEKAVGAGRFRIKDGYGKIERICVLKEERGRKIGNLLMARIEDYAKEINMETVKLEAQVHAIPFYEKLGYDICSEEFMDAGIPHRLMTKTF
ncbi:MAG: family acetyltransferase YjcF [Bacillales bacterium]|jgi:predicted GNAT family N-acyltransferase|nr:family acetyltransferase YjcF [Bacillales bacterium]